MKKRAAFFAAGVLVFGSVGVAQNVSFTTLAGQPGLTGTTDATGSAARFTSPMGLAIAPSGDVYVGTSTALRKVTSAGTVSTVATFNGSDAAIAVDGSGNAFVADPSAHVIREVTPAGVVTVFAGQPGVPGNSDGSLAVARFNGPSGLAFDANGNLFVADTNNETIRKIDSTGNVTTVAGLPGVAGSVDAAAPLARFYSPSGLAFDGAGNLFIADTGNNIIRKLAPDSTVSTFAGRATSYYGGTESDGVGTNAQFARPTGLAMDSAGNLLVTDSYGNTIRSITTGAVVSTIAGQFNQTGSADGIGNSARFSGPTGIVVDATGAIVVADSNNHTIRSGVRLSPPTITTQPASISVTAGQPASFALVAASTRTISYQWERRVAGTPSFVAMLDDATFSGTQTASLTISGTTTGMTGDQYRCVVNNGSGASVASNAALLTVTAAPAITSAASTTFYAAVAGNVTFKATGSPAPAFSVSSGALPSWATLDAASGILSGTPPSTAGSPFSFTVAAANGIGPAATQAFTLTVQPTPSLPAITMSGSAQTVVSRGQSFSLSATINGTGPFTYQWLHNGVGIAGATGLAYAVSNAAATDGGYYQLMATGPAGTTRSAARFVNISYSNTRVIGWGYDSSIPSTLNSAMAIAAGGSFGVALLSDTSVFAWGTNDAGQTTVPAGLTGVVAVAAGGSHVLALKSDGTVVAWGSNSSGQISVPAGLNNVIAVACGGSHSLALKSDGTVVAWGSNSNGQATPPSGLTNVMAIAASDAVSLALKSDGTVAGWGYFGGYSQPSSWINVISIAAGSSSQLAIKADHTVAVWETNWIGDPPVGTNNVVQVASSYYQAVALFADGTIRTWGPDYNDNLSLPANLRSVVAISASSSLRLALRDASNDIAPVVTASPSSVTINQGQLVTLTAVANTGTALANYQWYKDGTAIAGATTSTYTLTATTQTAGAYYATITNDLGTATTGTATVTVASSPVVSATGAARYPLTVGQSLTMTLSSSISSSASVQWKLNGVAIPGATNRSLSLANVSVSQSGYYQAVYNDGSGAIASAPVFVPIAPVATQVLATQTSYSFSTPPAGLSHVVSVTTGGFGSAAVNLDGSVVQWNSSYSPSPSLANVVSVAMGGTAGYALLGDGTVTAWGQSYYGSVTPPWTPPAGLNNVVAISAGYDHALALRADGTVVAWGASSGAIEVPSTLKNVIAVSAGNRYSLALRADGTVVGWGQNDHGQSTPPATLTDAIAIDAASSFAVALRANGTVVAWGITPASSLKPPADLNNVVAVAAGDSFVYALRADGTVVGWGQISYSNYTVPTVFDHRIIGLAAGSYGTIFVRDASGDMLPSIATQPASATVYLGQATTLSVSANGGTATLTYQWRKAGVAMPGATAATLTLPYATAAVAGTYDVVIIDQLGAATSNTAVVTVASTPGVTLAQTGRQVVNAGQSITLTGAAALSGTVAYQWMHDGRAIGGATATSLNIANATWRDGGVYQLRATNGVGPALSAPVFVAVPLTAQLVGWGSNSWGQLTVPADATTNVMRIAAGNAHTLALKNDGTILAWGDDSAFQCEVPTDLTDAVGIAAGNSFSMALLPDGSVRTWGSINFTPANVGPATAIAASPTSNVAMALRTDGTVVTWDPNGMRSDTPANLAQVVAIAEGGSFLALRADGTIVQWTTNNNSATTVAGVSTAVAVAAGVDFAMALEADGTVVAWGSNYNGATNVPTDLTHVVGIGASGSIAFALKDDGTLVNWGYSYSSLSGTPVAAAAPVYTFALGSNHALALRNATNDTVPAITAQTSDQSISLGQSLTLSVSTTGVPAPAFQWYRNGSAISGATTATLFIPSVGSYNGGTYTVAVSNAKGTVVSSPINVTLRPVAGSIGLLGSSARVNAGADAIFGSFTIEGGSKNILVRAVGPALTSFGVTHAMSDPELTITDANGVALVTNDDWWTSSNASDISSTATRLGAFALPARGKDAAVLRYYSPGTYQVQISPATGSGGVAMLEVYDADNTPRLVYTATMARTGPASGLLVQGLTIAEPPVGRSYLIRAIGPGLGISGTIPTPQIAVFDSTGAQVAANAGWGNDAMLATLAARVGGAPLSSGSLDAALNFVPPQQGTYTIQVKDVGSASGLVLLEVFEIDTQRSAAIAPAVVAPPQSVAVLPGQAGTLSTVVIGNPTPAVQWRKDGAPIVGATTTTLTLTNVQSSDAGTYSVKASNASGTATSVGAQVSVVSQLATHAVVGTGYVAGGTVTITNTLTYAGAAASLGWQVTLPDGWSVASAAGAQGDVAPVAGTTNTLEWAWSSPPPSPLTFTYTLNVPAGETGTKTITAAAIVRSAGTVETSTVAPATLSVDPAPATHSADTNADGKISLLELTRVIELYNTRNGTTRTGCYTVQTGTEDGFAADATRSSTASVTLTTYHAADENHDGKISLLELTRVIELYNYRSGTTRTGQYHVESGTEDGFAPGP